MNDEKHEQRALCLYQHLRSELVPPRVKTMAAAWQVWDSAQEGAGDTIHIDYDGEYGSERVLIVSGYSTAISLRAFSCTLRVRTQQVVPRSCTQTHDTHVAVEGSALIPTGSFGRGAPNCCRSCIRRS